MEFGSMIGLHGPCLYHKCQVVQPIPFLSIDMTTYEFDFVHHLLIRWVEMEG